MSRRSIAGSAALLAAVLLRGTLAAQADFVRGDVNQAGGLEIGDAVAALSWIFRDGAPPACTDAADFDDGGKVDLVDSISLLGFLFLGAPEPPAPFAAQGPDPTSDDLPCASYAGKELSSRSSLRLRFEGCPQRVSTFPGDIARVDVLAVLESDGEPSGEGPQAWSLSIGVEGAAVNAVTVQGVKVATLFDVDDGPSNTELVPFELDLQQAGFKAAQKATGDYPGSAVPGKQGVVSAIVLHHSRKMVLPASTQQSILKLTLDVSNPAGGGGCEVVLRFEDGYKGLGQPVRNIIVVNDVPYAPTLSECRFSLENCIPLPTTSPFVRCDANTNGLVELADAAWTINALFRGGPATACPAAADCNGDGQVNVSDVVYTVQYELLGGPAPPMPFPSCGRPAGLTPQDCPVGTSDCR